MKRLRNAIDGIRCVWCFFVHVRHHVNDETISQKDGEIKWYCMKCSRGWAENATQGAK